MPRTTPTMSSPPIVGRPFLDVMALRSVLADPLAEPEHVEEPDVRRHQDDHQGEREEQALDQLDGHRPAPSGRAPASQAVDDAIETDPPGGLDQDDYVAVPEARRDGIEAPPRHRNADDRAGSIPCGDRPLGDPRGAIADHDQPVDRPAAASPTTRWPSSLASPSSSISPRPRHAGRAGRPADPAPRPRSAATRYRYRRRASRTETDELDTVGADQPPARPAGDLVAVTGPRRGRRPPPPARYGPTSRPSVGMVTG